MIPGQNYEVMILIFQNHPLIYVKVSYISAAEFSSSLMIISFSWELIRSMVIYVHGIFVFL